MFLEAGDTCCTYFNMAIYEAKHKETEKLNPNKAGLFEGSFS